LENGDVATDISTALNVSGLEANRLAIEITEAVHLNLTNSVARQLNKISDMGVRISIDDFGTGYSSLSTINAIPVSCIKIDQSFTRKITSDSTSKIVVQTILEMADRLSICTVAEGVETEEEASIMTGMGATALQGYLFGRPLPAQAAFGNGQAFHAGIGLGVS
jgi:EAL domain-containing protein (putative c-di-GMP-specific phosphodiesterase class I)